MTISSTTTRVSYTGNGATTAFSFPYLFYSNDDLTVILITTATGAETVQTITTHYTVTGAGVGAGGTVTMLTAPTAAQTLLILREVDYDQQDFDPVDNDPFPAASIEQAVDYTVMMAQQLKEISDRSIKFPKGDSTALTTTLASSTSRANKALVFDASGNVGLSADNYTDQLANVTAQADAAAASAVAAAASESAAASSASTASTQAGLAATAKTNAETAETNAETAEVNAEAAQAAAEAAQAAAEAAQTAAETAETNAETAETNAETAQAAAELAQASAEAAAAAIFWNFDTTTAMADPGTGDLRLNNATVASVTAIAVSALVASTGNPDVSDQIVTWDDSTNTAKGTITIRKAGAPATFAVFTVSGSVTDNTTWLQIPVTHVASNGALSAGDDLYVAFSRAGDKGADGAGSGDVSGPASSTADAIALFDGTTGKLIKDSTYPITAAGAALLDDANAAAQRTTLGLGTAATAATGTSGNALPFMDGDNTWSGSQRGAITTDNDGSFDQNASNNFFCTTSGSTTLTFTNHTAGQSGLILFVNASNHAVSAAATTKIKSADLTTISATGTYLLTYFDNGTNAYVVASGALS